VPAAFRPAALLLALACLVGLAGCGRDEVEAEVQARVDRVEERVQARVDRARAQFEERRDRFGERIRQVLEDLEQTVPEAQQTSPAVQSRGQGTEAETVDQFLTRVLKDIDAYWETTFAQAQLPTPRVSYAWVPPGRVLRTSCGAPADDRAAFYCPADDTIYVAQQFAADLNAGRLRGLPGEQAGYGRAVGDFAVAYVLAHEYAHNLQQELGVFDNRVTPSAEPYELQADCLAGTWANSVFEQGRLEPGDLREATDAALAVGDFDEGNAQHHGTPTERRDALLAGYRSGDPSLCEQYLPQV
jgi:predicted metalloprotease